MLLLSDLPGTSVPRVTIASGRHAAFEADGDAANGVAVRSVSRAGCSR
jgi:hypothetical protein